MPDHSALNLLMVIVTTYLLHSILLLGGLWVSQRIWRVRSPFLREQLWKWATIGPLLTVLLQLTLFPPLARHSHGNLLEPLITWNLGADSISQFDPSSLPATAAVPACIVPPLTPELPIIKPAVDSASQPQPLVESHHLSQLPNPTATDRPPSPPLTERSVSSRPDSPRVSLPPAIITGVVPLEVEAVEPPPFDSEPSADWQIAIVPLPDSDSLDPSLHSTGDPSPEIDTLNHSVVSTPDATRTTGNQNASVFVPAQSVVGVSEIPQTTSITAPPRSYWREYTGALIALCLTIGFVRVCWKLIIVRQLLQRATVLTDGPARHTLDRLCERHDLGPHISLATSSECGEPAACGIWKPVILLPIGLEDRLSKEELKALLAHELAHIVRRDTLWLWIGRLVTSCLPFQPLNFIAVREWRQSSEYQCDDWAVERGVTAVALAKCLTHVAEWRLTGHVSPGVTASMTSLTDRVRLLMAAQRFTDQWKTGWRRRATTLTAIGVITLFTQIAPRTMWESPQADAAIREDSTPPSTSLVSEPRSNQLPLTTANRTLANAENLDGLTLNEQLQTVTADLARALTLLGEQEEDAEIALLIAQLRERIAAIEHRARSASTDLAIRRGGEE